MNIPTNLSDNTIELDITIFDIKIELHCRLNSTVD